MVILRPRYTTCTIVEKVGHGFELLPGDTVKPDQLLRLAHAEALLAPNALQGDPVAQPSNHVAGVTRGWTLLQLGCTVVGHSTFDGVKMSWSCLSERCSASCSFCDRFTWSTS